MRYCLYILIATLTAFCAKTPGLLEPQRSAPGSFANKQIRYMMPIDLFQVLLAAFPVEPSTIAHDCRELTPSNRALVGDSSASTGSPIFDQPSAGFVRWYAGCVNNYIRSLESESSRSSVAMERLFAPALTARITKDPYVARLNFSDLALAERKATARDLTNQMLGPDEVIKDFGYYKDAETLSLAILNKVERQNLSVTESCKQILFLLALRDEFLSY